MIMVINIHYMFIPNPENKPSVDHINRKPGINTIENLKWATHEEQAQNQTQPPTKKEKLATCQYAR